MKSTSRSSTSWSRRVPRPENLHRPLEVGPSVSLTDPKSPIQRVRRSETFPFFYTPYPSPPFPLPTGLYSDTSLAPAMSSLNDSSESASQENERRRADRKPAVRWRSRLGVATALFLVVGALNFAAAVAVPITLHILGPDAIGGLVLSNDGDTAFLGRSLTTVNAADP